MSTTSLERVMITTSPLPTSLDSTQGPWCGECDTDSYLAITSIGPLSPPHRNLLDIECRCAVCGTRTTHIATVRQIAQLLKGQEPRTARKEPKPPRSWVSTTATSVSSIESTST